MKNEWVIFGLENEGFTILRHLYGLPILFHFVFKRDRAQEDALLGVNMEILSLEIEYNQHSLHGLGVALYGVLALDGVKLCNWPLGLFEVFLDDGLKV